MSAEQTVAERFPRDVASHQMRILHDDGLYRQVRFANPERSWSYWYEIVTWPGRLTITGDCGTYTFARLDDMFEFFRSSSAWINPVYWAEKLCHPVSETQVRRYDEDAYRRSVGDWAARTIDDQEMSKEDARAFTEAARSDLLEGVLLDLPSTRHEALERLDRFRYQLDHGAAIYITDPWKWTLDDWNQMYLWCCHAIVHGIRCYDEAKAMT